MGGPAGKAKARNNCHNKPKEEKDGATQLKNKGKKKTGISVVGKSPSGCVGGGTDRVKKGNPTRWEVK